MEEKKLFTATDYFRPFPSPEDVFAGDVDRHAEHLLPLASVNLAHLSPDWSGWAHFITPVEPSEGVVGEDAADCHNYLCRENWVGYRVRDGKYELATDFRFFRKTRLGIPTTEGEPTGSEDDLAILYYNRHGGYHFQRERFAREGYLYHAYAEKGFFGYKRSDRCPLVSDLGGHAFDGNWAHGHDFPLGRFEKWTDADGDEQQEICPLTEDGRPFHFIGMVSVNEYVRPTRDYPGMDADLLLFYDPVGQVAVTTFDFS